MKLKLRHLEVMSGVLIAIFASEFGRTDFQARAYAAQMPATSAAAFLDSIGVNTHVDRGVRPRVICPAAALYWAYARCVSAHATSQGTS